MMKKLCLWLCLAALLGVLALPAFAVEVDRPCSLSLHYAAEGEGYAGLEVCLFRVAEYLDNGGYVLTGDFADQPVKIHGITSQTQWQEATQTLVAYTQADRILPTATAITQEDGRAVFTDLATGLYLVAGVDVETANSRFRFAPFLVFLPTPGEDGTPTYDMEARPKAGAVTPISRYSIVKLWNDAGASVSRPQSVTVEILKDGQLAQTVTLNGENNWSYTWKTEDTTAAWSVIERSVAPGYTVSITQNAHTFTIVNTAEGTPPPSPETGDSTSVALYVLLMGISLILLVVVMRSKRKKS